MKRYSAALAALLSLCVSLDARTIEAACGTHAGIEREKLHLHQNNRTYRAGRLGRSSAGAARDTVARQVALPDRGNIAVISAGDGVLIKPNNFDLNGRTVRFVPAADKYRFEVADGSYDAAAASAGTAISGLTDDDTREAQIAFAFPYFGRTWRSLHVNSDGNLTFGDGDGASAARSLGRLTSGLPRIAGLFDDLDPSGSAEGVRVLSESGRFVVSWVNVPEWTSGGYGRRQTFQMRLYPDGRIEFAYQDVAVSEAVVGISPGGSRGDSAVVDYVAGSTTEYPGAVAERFATEEEIDIYTAAQKFYLNHEDAYDYLVFYNSMGVDAGSTAVAYEVTLRNSRSGYGDFPVDIGNVTGSSKRLQSILNMGGLHDYPPDPNEVDPRRFTARDTPLTILGHEAGHLFLAYASVLDNDEPLMLGRDGAHWSFLFNSEASLLEGNRIEDRGETANPRFRTTATVQGYSPLDQYLMGFIGRDAVPPTFYVTGSTITNRSRPPQMGVTFNGQRRNVTVDDVIAQMGRRTPDHTVAQRHFRFAFVLIVPEGQEPNSVDLAQVDEYRKQFEGFYARSTGGNATADTTLVKALDVSTFPAAGTVLGGRGKATVKLQTAPESPLALTIRTNGVIAAPNAVIVPAGAKTATFEWQAAGEGVDDLVVEASGGGYEVSRSRVQVLPVNALHLSITSGNAQNGTAGQPLAKPVRARVLDANGLAYSGVTVTAVASTGGTVAPGTAVSDADGYVEFGWTPGAETLNELRLSTSSGATATATVAGKPAISRDGVVNAASYQAGVAPGSIASVFGVNLFGANPASIEVRINSRPVTIFYADNRQINFYVPADIPTGTARLEVGTSVGQSTAVDVPVRQFQPGIFYDTANGYGAVLVAGTGQRTDFQAVARGGYVEIYATGLGPLMGSDTASPVEAWIDGRAVSVTYSGTAPGFTGLYQVNVQIPADAAVGVRTLEVGVQGARSNAVKIAIR